MDDSRPSTSFDTDGPSFGITLGAVLIGGLISGFFESLLFGAAPLMTHTGWTILTSVIGAVGVRFALRMFGYEISLIAAVCASVVGSVVNVFLQNAVLGAGNPGLVPLFSISGFAGLLLTTWLIQTMARSNEGGFH
jgi:hypothetical protein